VAGAACRQGAREGVCTREAGPLICEAPFDVVDGVAGSDGSLFARNPRTFHADVTFAGKTFRSVGLRYKGNSSLRRDDGERLPLRIEADAFEDEDPAVDDQRIFGFEALSFAPGAMDASRMHQVLASEVFRAHGVPAPLSTFVEVTLDFGAGPVSLGVYAMTEIPDKPLLDRDFGEHDGHLYKPEGKGAHLVTFDEASYDLESGDEATAYRDLRALLAALHAPQTDRAAWRTQLAATFDVDGFLQARAVNQAISNWDTYGALAHNFYLYTSEDGVTHFLPWDFDLAFDGSGNSDLAQTSFGGEWPLLQAIARDAVLATRYQQYLQAFYDDEMATGALWARAQRMAGVVAPALERESAASAESARAGLERLRGHIEGQTARVAAHLETFGRGAE
jgi:hypothetical protein